MKKKRKTLSNSIDGLSLVQLELEIWLVAVFDNSPQTRDAPSLAFV